MTTRHAIITQEGVRIETVLRYLPSNYTANEDSRDGKPVILIEGEDSAGWTLDDYVGPRLASGGIYITEVTSE